MTAEDILTRTFADHEGDAPDPETVLDRVHARLARRRAIPVLAAAATVAVIALGASVLVGQQRPAPNRAAAVPSPTGMIALDAGWLPAGTARTVLVQHFYDQQIRVYSVTGPDGDLIRVELRLSLIQSDAADEEDSVDLGGRRIIKKK